LGRGLTACAYKAPKWCGKRRGILVCAAIEVKAKEKSGESLPAAS